MASRKEALARRANRVRRHLKSVANGRPRLSVHRSSKNIYAQVIDDVAGKTLASASTLEKDLRGSLKTGADTAAATVVGKLLAERASKAGVTEVVFDRGAFIYHAASRLSPKRPAKAVSPSDQFPAGRLKRRPDSEPKSGSAHHAERAHQ